MISVIAEKEKSRVANPLWVISLFLTLTEVTVGVVSTQSDGWVRVLFAAFSVSFPTAIAAIFFFFLWTRPDLLYAPQDFSAQTTVDAYVSAMNSARSGQIKTVETVLRSAISSNIEEFARDDLSAAERTAAVDAAVEGARRRFEDLAISVRLDEVDEDFRSKPALSVLVDPDGTTFGDLVSQIDAAMSRYIEPGSYGRLWSIRDDETSKSLPRAPSAVREARLLRDLGVMPGARLTVEPLIRPRSNTAL
jgi:hypothetical protein